MQFGIVNATSTKVVYLKLCRAGPKLRELDRRGIHATQFPLFSPALYIIQMQLLPLIGFKFRIANMLFCKRAKMSLFLILIQPFSLISALLIRGNRSLIQSVQRNNCQHLFKVSYRRERLTEGQGTIFSLPKNCFFPQICPFIVLLLQRRTKKRTWREM